LSVEVDTEGEKGQSRSSALKSLEDDLSHKRDQLDELANEESYQMKELRESQDELDRLYKELKQVEDENKYLDNQNAKLCRVCGNAEEELANGRNRNRDLTIRIESVTRFRNTMEEETGCCRDENDDLKAEINDYRKDLGMREGQANNELRPRARALESELAECEERSETQIRELQRIKNDFNEQLNKNANYCDDSNHLEVELQSVKTDLESSRNTLAMYEEKKTSSYMLNKELLIIIEELQRAIDELTNQNKNILNELTIIADQDEHVQVILNRREKVEQLKHSSEEKTKKYVALDRTISTAFSPQRSPNRSYTKVEYTSSYSNVKRSNNY